jgi:hypothetical protein
MELRVRELELVQGPSCLKQDVVNASVLLALWHFA